MNSQKALNQECAAAGVIAASQQENEEEKRPKNQWKINYWQISSEIVIQLIRLDDALFYFDVTKIWFL